MVSKMDLVQSLSETLDITTPTLDTLDSYYRGTQPTAFLAKKSSEALGDRLRSLSVNFPRLAVRSLAERLNLTGFRLDGPDARPDDDLWRIWRLNHMEEAAAQAHIDALVYGRSFVIVWAGRRGPQITVESPRQMSVAYDPATREVTAAFKRWVSGRRGHAVLYGADEITRFVSSADVSDPSALPSTSWQVAETIPNPLGEVPVVPIVNHGRLLEVDGVSEMQDILGLSDALNKLMADAMVTSEYYARPRRWVTGLEAMEDDDGNLVDPFSSEEQRVWQAESPDVKFGQFDPVRLDGYADLTAVVTQQIGALTGLPAHYMGLHGDQPASADAIRSAEASLVARAYALHRTFGQGWSDVARLIVAVRDGVDPSTVDVEPVWASPETRTPAQAADAAAKLAGIGVPLSVVLGDVLGMTPTQIERVRAARRGDALDAAGADLLDRLSS